MTDRSTEHWRGLHYDAAHITGPIPFLNPTTRFLGVHQQPQKHHVRAEHHGQEKDASALPTPTPGTEDHDEDGKQKKQLSSSSSSSQQHTGVYNVWRSRDNRKGRHALALAPSVAEGTKKSGVAVNGLRPTNTLSAMLAGVARMVTRYPVWDVSYDVAVVFTLGSVSDNITLG